MLVINNKALKITNKWLNPIAGSGPTPGPTPPEPVVYYYVHDISTNGEVISSLDFGSTGTIVEIYNIPNSGYVFTSYDVTGTTLEDDEFVINNQDVYINANYTFVSYDSTYNPLNLPPYTIRLQYENNFDPRNVTNASTFTQVSSSPNVWDWTYEDPDWNRTRAYRKNIMFTVQALTKVLGANTYGVNNMIALFRGASQLTSIALFDTRLISSMDYMFERCHGLTSLPNFNTSNVISMDNTFHECLNITTIPNYNTSKVICFENTYSNCNALTTAPNIDTSNALSTYHMFTYSAITTFPNYNTSKVRNCAGMFIGTGISSAPNIDISKSYDISTMFFNCASLTSVPLYDTSSALNASNMFYGCTNVQSGALALYNQLSAQYNIPTHSGTFKNCGKDTTAGAAELAQIPSGWK